MRSKIGRKPLIRRLALCALLFALLARGAQAQRLVALDVSVGANNGGQRLAASAWLPLTTLLERITLSGGARLTSYNGESGTFGNRGTVTAALTPRLNFPSQVVGFAIAVQAEVAIVGPLSVGFNIDLAGVAAGGDQSVAGLTARVQRGSLLLGGSPDVGALNSETYVAWAFAPTFTFRAGTTHFVTNYEVRDPASPGVTAAKYQQFKTLPFVAVGWRF